MTPCLLILKVTVLFISSGFLSLQALDTFNTAVVSPIYYVMFTSLTILASVIMFKVLSPNDPLLMLCWYVQMSLLHNKIQNERIGVLQACGMADRRILFGFEQARRGRILRTL